MKFYGAIGYVKNVEQVLGVWKPAEVVERNYYGDVLTNGRRLEKDADQQNDNLRITNKFSILADPYAYQNFHDIKYIVFMGVKWKVREITVDRRRLIISVGEEYNE